MRIFLVSTLILFTLSSQAQNPTSAVIHSNVPFPTVPKINVTGTAEMQVAPDQIYFRIVLNEDKTSRRKTYIDSLENKLFRVLTQFEIPRKNLSMVKNSQRIIDHKRKDAEVEITREFSLLISDKVNLRKLLLAFHENKFYNIRITHIDHSKKDEFMQKVRADAMQNAQTKVEHLLSAINKNSGALLEVNPVGHNNVQFTNLAQVNSMYNTYLSSKRYYSHDFDYDKLKLHASYRLIYEIKN